MCNCDSLKVPDSDLIASEARGPGQSIRTATQTLAGQGFLERVPQVQVHLGIPKKKFLKNLRKIFMGRLSHHVASCKDPPPGPESPTPFQLMGSAASSCRLLLSGKLPGLVVKIQQFKEGKEVCEEYFFLYGQRLSLLRKSAVSETAILSTRTVAFFCLFCKQFQVPCVPLSNQDIPEDPV